MKMLWRVSWGPMTVESEKDSVQWNIFVDLESHMFSWLMCTNMQNPFSKYPYVFISEWLFNNLKMPWSRISVQDNPNAVFPCESLCSMVNGFCNFSPQATCQGCILFPFSVIHMSPCSISTRPRFDAVYTGNRQQVQPLWNHPHL